MENGPAREGVEVLSRALALCEELGLRVGAVYTKIYLGYARVNAGDPIGAIREFEGAADLAVELHFPEQQADSHERRALAYIALGQLEEACRHAERAVELTGAVSSYQYEITTQISLGNAQLHAGRLDEAMANLLHALDGDKVEFQFPVLHGELALASGYRQRGEYDRAARILDHVLASTYRPYRGDAFVELARIHLDQNNPETAIDHATTGLDIVRACQYRVSEAHALWVLGQAHQARGDQRAADACLNQAAEIFKRIGSRLADQL